MDLEYVWGIELIRIEDNEEDRKIDNDFSTFTQIQLLVQDRMIYSEDLEYI